MHFLAIFTIVKNLYDAIFGNSTFSYEISYKMEHALDKLIRILILRVKYILFYLKFYKPYIFHNI